MHSLTPSRSDLTKLHFMQELRLGHCNQATGFLHSTQKISLLLMKYSNYAIFLKSIIILASIQIDQVGKHESQEM